MSRSLQSVLVMLLLGVAGGFVWLWLAHPAEWEVRSGGIVLTEAASKGQFSVVVVFVVVGLIASLAWGFGATWLLRDLGWIMTPIVVVATVLAAVIAWRIGVALGPPDPSTVRGAAIGDRLPSELRIDGLAPFLVWPIFGILGLIIATWLDRPPAPSGPAAL